MFGDDAKQLLTALNLPASGEMMTAQLPTMITRLQQIIEIDKHANPVIWPELLQTEEEKNEPVIVRFSQRATPMVQLMERCISATEPISW